MVPKIHPTNPTWSNPLSFTRWDPPVFNPFAKLFIRIFPGTVCNLHFSISPLTVQADQRSFQWRLLLPWWPLLPSLSTSKALKYHWRNNDLLEAKFGRMANEEACTKGFIPLSSMHLVRTNRPSHKWQNAYWECQNCRRKCSCLLSKTPHLPESK